MKVYPQRSLRTMMNLDGVWDFAWAGDCSWDKLTPEGLVFDDCAAVPGVFDTFPAAPGRRGVGVYRCRLSWPSGTPSRLCLDGMGLRGRIWWDGKEIGSCRLPYSGVVYDFDSGVGEEHELVIAVDNRFEPERAQLLSPNFDFYAFGGIYRHVELQQLPETYLERVQVITLDRETGLVRLRLLLGGNIPSGRLAFSVAFDRNGAEPLDGAVVDGAVEIERRVPDHRIWTPDVPALHTVTVAIAGDAITEQFGIRTVVAEKQQILLNGKPVRLIGVNRHESHPEFGPVQPLHLMVEDLHLVKELGGNFVRCVHYPHDQAFLDLCDRMGILVWQESMGWNNPESDALDPEFMALQQAQTELMVRNSINHPAVIMYGFLNECCSDTEGGKALYRLLAETIRREDSSRLVTFASNRKKTDICFEFADVMAMTMYPGWIEGIGDWTTPSSDWIASFVADLAAFAEREDLRDKPFLVAEIGACGIYGCHDRALAQWSEEYQADYFTAACQSILSHPRYAGVALWQMFDTRSYVNVGQVRCKALGFNLAGLFDAYRRPKLAYDAVREIFRAAAK